MPLNSAITPRITLRAGLITLRLNSVFKGDVGSTLPELHGRCFNSIVCGWGVRRQKGWLFRGLPYAMHQVQSFRLFLNSPVLPSRDECILLRTGKKVTQEGAPKKGLGMSG